MVVCVTHLPLMDKFPRTAQFHVKYYGVLPVDLSESIDTWATVKSGQRRRNPLKMKLKKRKVDIHAPTYSNPLTEIMENYARIIHRLANYYTLQITPNHKLTHEKFLGSSPNALTRVWLAS